MTAPDSPSRSPRRSSRAARYLVPLAAVLALGALWLALRPAAASPWQTVTVARGDIEASVAAIGTLQPLRSVDVGAQVSGQITRLLVRAGDAVEKGQLLAEIDASVLAATGRPLNTSWKVLPPATVGTSSRSLTALVSARPNLAWK